MEPTRDVEREEHEPPFHPKFRVPVGKFQVPKVLDRPENSNPYHQYCLEHPDHPLPPVTGENRQQVAKTNNQLISKNA